MKKILIVDDDPHIVRTLEIMLGDEGYEVSSASSGEQAIELMKGDEPDLAFLDMQLPGISGADVLRHIRDNCLSTEVIIITAYGSIESAVEAIKDGAFDYLTKPFSPEQVRHRLKQLHNIEDLRSEVAGLQRRLGELPFRGKFFTRNKSMLQILQTARSVAQSDLTILINGESGTGKTVLARMIHEASRRSEGPFVTLDCTCFQESLLESELFGHKKGAFTGAVTDKVGKAELADGGTLFLDEIGEIPPHLQGKLLRLVDEKAYERVRDPVTRNLDIRIIAATNRDLNNLVEEKAFREDLFFRLSVVDLMLPPLRSRPEDILLLGREFVSRFSLAHDKRISGWDKDTERLLLTYPWPGNVRELAHALERAVLLAAGRKISREHLPKRILQLLESPTDSSSLNLTLAQLEEQHIRSILSLNHSVEESSRRLGIDPSTLWRKRKRYGI